MSNRTWRIPQHSYFPNGKQNSTANQEFQFRMSKRSLQSLGGVQTTKKKAIVGRYHRRNIAVSGGGVPSAPAQTLGSMDRLARLKAAAIKGTN